MGGDESAAATHSSSPVRRQRCGDDPHNVDAVRQSGARRIVRPAPRDITPGGTNTRKHREPLGFEVVHAVDVVDELTQASDHLHSYNQPSPITSRAISGGTAASTTPAAIISVDPGHAFAEMKDNRSTAWLRRGGDPRRPTRADRALAQRRPRTARKQARGDPLGLHKANEPGRTARKEKML